MPFPLRMRRALASPLPSQCAVCGCWCASRVCAACIARFAAPAHRCAVCAARIPSLAMHRCGECVRQPPAYGAAVAAVDYAFPWSRLLLSFKFHGALDLTATLSARLAGALSRAAIAAPDLLLPVPASTVRLRERGFNPAWEIARRLPLGSRADAALLLRVKDTAHQLALPRDRRGANVRGAFAVDPLRRAEVAGRRIAIVDDVMTTGSTAGEIARVLRQAGAADVQVWVVARATRPGHAP